MKKSFNLLLILIIPVFIQAQQKHFLQHWQFYKGEIASPWEAFRPENLSKLPVFKTVSVPHCYNAFDAVDPDTHYYQGRAWYYTWFKDANPYQNGRTILHFDGSGQKTDVFIFMQKAGSHTGGYDKWKIDITRMAKSFSVRYPNGIGRVPKGMVPLAVRCDNSRNAERIPSQLSDFTIYGGLYRPVWVEYLPQVSVDQVHIHYTLNKNRKEADVTIDFTFYNPDSIKKPLTLKTEIFDKNKQKIYSSEKTINPSRKGYILTNIIIKRPELWSPDHPALYSFRFAVSEDGQKQIKTLKSGFRQFYFAEKGPFYLNGKRLLLRGTSRHEDYAGEGAAGSKKEMKKEMLMIKAMGANFIRLGHYQQPDYILDLCDSLGILVWEEIPWCRGGLGNAAYKQEARNMLKDLINQHYNHPSIIIWGLGNENDWPGDFPTFNKDSIRNFMKSLNLLAHRLDNSRETAIRRCDFCKDIVDVYSPSIWAGWYRGKYTDYKKVSYADAMQVNHFLHAEWGASMHAGRHSEDPDKGLAKVRDQNKADERSGDFLLSGGEPRVSKDGDWSETYGCNLIDWTLKEQETMKWLTGSAFWIFKDFSTPLRPHNPIPYVNEKGVVQRDLTPKEAYYVFQSYWSKKPMLHIYGHTWPVRWGKTGEDKLLKVYSNCKKVELFLNGKSLGSRKRDSQNFPAAGLRWKTTFKEGENRVMAIARVDGKIIKDSIHFFYQTQPFGKPNHIKIYQKALSSDTLLITVKVYDKDGVFCPTAKNWVTFGITGKGKLIDDLGTENGSRKIQMSNGKATIRVLVTGKAVVSAVCPNLTPVFENINQISKK